MSLWRLKKIAKNIIVSAIVSDISTISNAEVASMPDGIFNSLAPAFHADRKCLWSDHRGKLNHNLFTTAYPNNYAFAEGQPRRSVAETSAAGPADSGKLYLSR